MRTSCCADAPASSSRERCSTGTRRPAAIYCKPRSRPARRRVAAPSPFSIRADRKIAQPQIGEAALLPQPEQRPVERLPQQVVAPPDRDADALTEEAALDVRPAAEHAAVLRVGAVEPE